MSDLSSPNHSISQMVKMNTCAYLGRRDAAYNRLLDLLQKEIPNSDKHDRHKLYHVCQELLDQAIGSARDAVGHSVQNPVIEYFKLLNNTIGAAAALVKYELSLPQDAARLENFMDKSIIRHLRQTEEAFSHSEMNIFYCVKNLLKAANSAINKDRTLSIDEFNQTEKHRYETALEEYIDYYRDTETLYENALRKAHLLHQTDLTYQVSI